MPGYHQYKDILAAPEDHAVNFARITSYPSRVVGEDCGGGPLRLFPAYDVGELDSMDHLFFNDLGGEPLSLQDRFPGNSLIGIE